MGYTHYTYYRQEVMKDDKKWNSFTDLVKKICKKTNDWGIDLETEISDDLININGSDNQRLNKRVSRNAGESLVWPDDSVNYNPFDKYPTTTWDRYAWEVVDSPVAPYCVKTNKWLWSYENIVIRRVLPKDDNRWIQFECCKTNFRPYDITITAVLLAFEYIYWLDVELHSDWDEKDRVLWYRLFVDSTWLDTKTPDFKRRILSDKFSY